MGDGNVVALFSVWFAGQERWGLENSGQYSDRYDSTHTATSGLMAWSRRNSNVDSMGEKRWGHVFRIWDRWPEDEAEESEAADVVALEEEEDETDEESSEGTD